MSAEKGPEASGKAIEEIQGQVQRGELEPAKAIWLARKRLPWKEWLYVDFLRYWYLLGFFALEIFLSLELARDLHLHDAIGALFIAPVLVVIAYLAFRLYRFLWPEGPLTNMNDRPKRRGRRDRHRFE